MTSREPVENKEVNGEIIMHWNVARNGLPGSATIGPLA